MTADIELKSTVLCRGKSISDIGWFLAIMSAFLFFFAAGMF
jgi:hypothetical protein